MTRALVVDAIDPPLGATERVLATVAAADVLRGLGIVALAHPRARLTFDVADERAVAALRGEAERVGARIADGGMRGVGALRLRPSALVERAWHDRGAPVSHVLTIAGAVADARVVVAPAAISVDALVRAAGPRVASWVALWGGASGTIVDRALPLHALIDTARPRLLLVLPAGHGLVRRARTPLSSWLRRAQSACASCGLCAPACPEGVPAPEILRALVAGARARSPKLATAAACTGCGACDLVCPQAISPARVVDDLGVRLRLGGVGPPRTVPRAAPRLADELALVRLGLARYGRSRPVTLAALDAAGAMLGS